VPALVDELLRVHDAPGRLDREVLGADVHRAVLSQFRDTTG